MAFLPPHSETPVCRRQSWPATVGLALLFALLGGFSLSGVSGDALGKAALGVAESAAVDQHAHLRDPTRAPGARNPAAGPDRDKGDGHDIADHHPGGCRLLWSLSARPSPLIRGEGLLQLLPLHARPQRPRAPPHFLDA